MNFFDLSFLKSSDKKHTEPWFW